MKNCAAHQQRPACIRAQGEQTDDGGKSNRRLDERCGGGDCREQRPAALQSERRQRTAANASNTVSP